MPLTRNRAQISHQTVLGKLVQIYLAALDPGVSASAIVDQNIYLDGGYQQTVTVATAAAGVYSLTVNGVVIGSYTAGAGDTVAIIRNALLASVKLNTPTTGIFAGKPTTGAFVLLSGQTFTAASTGATPANMTLGATALVTNTTAKGATSVTLFEPLLGPVYAGQYLCFADSNDVEKSAKVTVSAAIGATTLTVRALDEAITAGSGAEFPTYLWDRTDASLDETFATVQTVTFNTGGAQLQTPTTIDRKITLPGIKWHYNAAFRTAAEQADLQKFIYVKRLEPAPNPSFITGDSIVGIGVVTSNKQAGQANAPISGDLEISFSGAVIKAVPVPVTP
ncbi:MAG: hypothetical protein KME27_10595 [Lyngbya sp. HA4199-MV5]|jgi:hypothetical protein|nr:hypothetical protein [Lyngbya sp. HA4199-MV5]